MKRPFEIEVCVNSVESAIEAQKCGADRVELCARLDLDGLTPNNELILKTREAISIGLHVIIRPREGDFTANQNELDQMAQSIEFCRKNGVDGVVFGILNQDGSLNYQAVQTLIDESRPMSVTFHRAFDVCRKPMLLFDQLNELKIDRLLTSGHAQKAIEGVDLIARLSKQDSVTNIMAGSGVNASNVVQLWKAGVRQFHFTSHIQNEMGINVFDENKTRMIIRKLEEECGI